MNAVAEAKTQTYTEEERAAWKKAVAEIKQRLKDLAVWQAHNKLALKENQRSGGGDQYVDINGKPTFGYSKEYWEQYITTLHILYNRLRNRPAHTGTVRIDTNDAEYLSGYNPQLHYAPGIYKDLVCQFCGDLLLMSLEGEVE